MNLHEFKDLLLTILPDKVSHNRAYQQKDNYLVWREMSKNTLRADSVTAESAHVIALDYFTKTEFDDIPEQLEIMFDNYDIAYTDVEIIYDEDRKETHYAWTVEVI